MNSPLNEPLVVVTPVYEDTEASSQLFRELEASFGGHVYVVAVDDGSVRQPVDVASIEAAGLRGVVVRLKRNVGHQRAIAIGLSYVAEHMDGAQRVVVMDSDGEDLPESIKELVKALDSEAVDVVVAERRSRVETIKFRAFYVVYKWLFRLLSGHTINFGNFMALKPAAVKRLVSMRELWTHVASCVLASKLRVATRSAPRGPRYAGQSKMNFVGLALHGFRALMVFAEDVLTRVVIACAGLAFLSVLAGATAAGLKLGGIATPGWCFVASGVSLSVFLLIGGLTFVTLMAAGANQDRTAVPARYEELIDRVSHAAATSSRSTPTANTTAIIGMYQTK